MVSLGHWVVLLSAVGAGLLLVSLAMHPPTPTHAQMSPDYSNFAYSTEPAVVAMGGTSTSSQLRSPPPYRGTLASVSGVSDPQRVPTTRAVVQLSITVERHVPASLLQQLLRPSYPEPTPVYIPPTPSLVPNPDAAFFRSGSGSSSSSSPRGGAAAVGSASVPGAGSADAAEERTRELERQLQAALARAGVDAQTEATRLMEEVMGQIRAFNQSAAAGIDRLRTTDVSVSPLYDTARDGRVSRQNGVRVRESLAFRVSGSVVGALLSALVNVDTMAIDSVVFVADEADLARANDRALRSAVKTTLARGRAVLEEAGCAADRMRVRELNVYTPDEADGSRNYDAAPMAPMAMKAFGGMASAMGSGPLPVVGGDVVLVARAHVQMACDP